MTRTLRLLAFAILLFSSISAAQPKKKTTRDELPPAAQALWDDAMRQMTNGSPDWPKAAAKFQEAYDVSKNPKVLFNVGVCERNMEHYARAIAKFRQELAEGASKLSAQEKADTQATIDALQRYVSTIEILTTEADAIVFVDDQKVGQTPIAPIPADVGQSHVVRVEKDGFLPFEKRDVRLTSTAATKVTVELEPKDKRSEVIVTVSGTRDAAIFIDGIDRGPAPFKGIVDVGPHTFEARQAGFDNSARREEVVYKQPLKVDLPMARSVTTGHVRIESVDGATIELDGKVVGMTFWEGTIEMGTHTLAARKDGYNDGKIEIYLDKGATVTRRLPLTAEKKNEWVFWTVGTVIVVAGVATVAAFVFAPKDQSPVIGTLDPGLVTAHHGFRF
jgi:PEGA domain